MTEDLGGVMKSLLLLAFGLVVAVTPTVVVSESAGASIPPLVGTCDMTITSSIKLANDVSCVGLPVMTIQAPSGKQIVVDLGGHAVSSTNVPAVQLSNAGGTVSVQNGRVVGGLLATGTGTTSAPFQLLQKLTFDGEGVTSSGSNVKVKHSVFANGANVTGQHAGWDLESNTFIGNGTGGPAIDVINSSGLALFNKISGYDVGISIVNGDLQFVQRNQIMGNGTGIRIGDSSGSPAFADLIDNTIEFSRGDGVVASDGATGILTSNHIRQNGGDGVLLQPTGASSTLSTFTFTNNVVKLNAGIGIAAASTSTITVIDGGSNSAKQNVAGQCSPNIVC